MNETYYRSNNEKTGWQSARDFLGEGILLDSVIKSTPETPSTQTDAKIAARAGAPHGTVFVTDFQSAGRGRRDRVWIARPGLDLTFSVILRPEIEPRLAPLLNLAAALSVCRAVGDFFTEPRAVSIKWPNDVLARGKKICGIICETAGGVEKPGWAVLGIGLNVNGTAADMPPDAPDKPEAASMFMECGRLFHLPELLGRVLTCLDEYTRLIGSEGDRARLLSLYGENCSTLGSGVKVITDEGEFFGTASGIEDDGAITVTDSEGHAATFRAADVVHLRSLGMFENSSQDRQRA
ncbi:MAG: biotin--[acetyl-CoA-carboxylase] ligase [Synergistaceae bacterium]|jgi:BirA family biotin operon repressor/biotin-[acetyl-CoA-carboxylase] ligase|nr:biotin--[acetyl-CoA-carboxylase] ligase [Synergistaceae bacterium]